MQKEINLSVIYEDGTAIISIGGEVTAVTGEEVKKVYDTSSEEGAMNFVLHFDQDCYLNSGGLAFLMDIATESKKKKQAVCVCGLSDHFKKIFKMLGLTRCFETFQCEDDKIK